jgi:hypothetical protein
MSFALIIDIVVAILLMVTIGYAIVLNKRLGNLRRDRSELEKLAINFHASTTRADESITRLTSSVGGLQDDLIFLTERGSSTADRLEESVRFSRGDVPVDAPKPTKASLKLDVGAGLSERVGREINKPSGLKANETDRIDSEGVSEAEKELLKALRSAS